MSQTPSQSTADPMQVVIYQIAGDEMFRGHRPGDTGWEWSWADWQRDWMDNSASKFAYRCLPLTIANQAGWWVKNPVGFTATWSGRPEPGQIKIIFDAEPGLWSQWINDQFGLGIITWNTPFLFRTKPEGSRLLVCGPLNYFKHGIQPLTAIVESDWMNMSFTMNWKITSAGATIRFDRGEPLFQAIPLASNICSDLQDATVTYMRLADDAEVAHAYERWKEMRTEFHAQKRSGQVRPTDWQKDYFQGRDALGREVTSGHTTKITPPAITFKSPKP
ncbi:MAG TPA: DUF6065 family protein [Tepidisphaeraceae bacterium]|jgi:hypothetical protein|nr:DUF6065 family protein [Tepidisphaeraceae bacterium]